MMMRTNTSSIKLHLQHPFLLVGSNLFQRCKSLVQVANRLIMGSVQVL